MHIQLYWGLIQDYRNLMFMVEIIIEMIDTMNYEYV